MLLHIHTHYCINMACRCQGGLPSAKPVPSSALFSMAVSLLGGLGASSCCVLQLALNAVGLGCAGGLGFGHGVWAPNGGLGTALCATCVAALCDTPAGFAVLTPYEPIFKGITLAALAHLLLRDGFSNRRALLTTALSLGLLFSQVGGLLATPLLMARPNNAPFKFGVAGQQRNIEDPGRRGGMEGVGATIGKGRLCDKQV